MAKKNRGVRGQRRADKVRSRRQRIAQGEARRESHARSVVERAGDPAYVQRVRNADGSSTISWDPGTPVGGEIQDGLTGQLDAFRLRFGREPGPQDPIFFDPDADEPTPITEERMTSMLDTMIAGMEDAGEDTAELKAWRDLGYVVTEQNVHTFSSAEVEAWEDAVADYEFDDEPDLDTEDFLAVLESILRQAVADTIEQRTAEPARAVARLIVSTDVMAAEEADDDDAVGLSAAFAVLAGWLTGIRERDPDVPMADGAVAYVRAEIGPRPGDAAGRAAALLGPCSTAAPELSVQELADELRGDFLPALLWLTAGAVVRFGDGDVAWLPGSDEDLDDDWP